MPILFNLSTGGSGFTGHRLTPWGFVCPSVWPISWRPPNAHALTLYKRLGWLDVQESIAGSDSPSRPLLIPGRRVHAFGADSVLRRLDKDGPSQGLFALYTFQKLAERHLKGRCQSRKVAKTDLARPSFEVRYVNLMNTRLFGEIDLPPTPFLSELPDSFAKLDANIRRHSSSIDLVEALYLVDALSCEIRPKIILWSRVLGPVCRDAPTTRRQWQGRQPKPKIL